MALILWIWLAGVLVSMIVLAARAFGHPMDAGAWMSNGQFLRSIPWVLACEVNAFIWPIVLLLWFKADKPPPPTLYGARAAHELGLPRNEGFNTRVHVRERWQLLGLAMGTEGVRSEPLGKD